MTEEKQNFKITDRRLFNPDGSPRDIEPTQRPTVTPTPDTTESPASSANVISPVTATADEPTPIAPHATADAAATSATTPPPAAAENDPLFVELMMFVAENAAAMLGGHPQLGGEPNLPYAKQFIDMLGSLRDKTIGNLSPEEQETLEALLSQLRMRYISQTSARPATPPPPGGGFTGSDITGGR